MTRQTSHEAAPLLGRVVVVTGGGIHLGAAYSRDLARRGAHVVVADLNDTSELVAELKDEGLTAIGSRIDVTDPTTLTAMVDDAVAAFGRIDGLVNNAGYFRNAFRGPVEDISDVEWTKCFDINVRGTWNAIKAVLPTFKAAGYGKIVNVSSATSFKGLPEMAHYVSSKAAVVGLTRGLAKELGEFNICVNTLAPDYVPDEAMDERRSAPKVRAVQARCIQRNQTPDDLVGTVAYLCGPGSDFVTGQTLHVNGGAYLS